MKIQMRSALTGLLALILSAMACATAAQPQVRVKLLESFPSGPQIEVAPNEIIYLRIGFDTDSPVRIWPRPYLRGQEVKAGSSPSRIQSGSGEMMGWFFLMPPGGEVDEIRVSAGDGSPDGTREVARWPLQVESRQGAPAPGPQPQWVVRMNAEADAAAQRDYEARMAEPAATGDWLLFNGFMLTMLAVGAASIVWPLWALRKWRGAWRFAAALPLAWIAFVVLRILIDTAADPTSHNLWPFEILYAGVVILPAMGMLAIVRWLSGARAR